MPIDFSEESKKALQYAVPLAEQFGALITLLHVVEPELYPADFGYGPVTMQLPNKELQRRAKTRLDGLAKKIIGWPRVTEVLVLNGAAHFEITEAAKALETDLIVIGTHGYTGLDRALVGSTTGKVVRRAPCPVLVVRRKEHEFVI